MLKEKNIYFKEGLYEDKLFSAELYAKVDKIGLIDNRVYIWFIYGKDSSITMNKVLSNFKERQVSIDRLWQYLPEIRKAHQIAFYMNHDLLIYLREFYAYSEEDKNEIFDIASEFIQKHKKIYLSQTCNSQFKSGMLGCFSGWKPQEIHLYGRYFVQTVSRRNESQGAEIKRERF